MDIETIRIILTTLGVAITLGTAVWVIRTNKKFKQSDVLLEYRKRYDDIQLTAGKLDRIYYKKRWGLFHDEFVSFINGNISHEIFMLWSLNFLNDLVRDGQTKRNTPLNLITSCPIPLRKLTAKQAENLPVKFVLLPQFHAFITQLYEYRREIRYQRLSKFGITDTEMYESVLKDIKALTKKYRKNVLQQIIDS